MSDRKFSMAGRRALVADDEPVVRSMIAWALEAIGFSVEQAGDGADAVAGVERARPDLVLLDVDMPELDGFGACAAMRGSFGSQELPVMMVTGHTDGETINRAFEAGATDFISKPLDWQLLQHRVRFLMRAYDAFHGLQHTLEDLRSSRERLDNAQRIAQLGNWEWVVGEREMLWSDQLHRTLGIEPAAGAASPKTLIDAVHPADRDAVEKALGGLGDAPASLDLAHRIITGTGEVRTVHHQVELIVNESGAAARFCGTVQDVTEQKRAEEQIRYLSYHDSLTSLPNRRMLTERLSSAIRRAKARDDRVAVLCVDLDRFKRVNDTLGPAVGDELLKAFGERLIAFTRGSWSPPGTSGEVLVSRLGADEFAVVLGGALEAEGTAIAALQLLDIISEPMEVGGEEIVMSATIGAAIHPEDARNAEDLIGSSEAAMHNAKSQGGGGFLFFNDSMNRRAVRELQLERSLRAATARGDIAVHFQPVIDTVTGRIERAEALARWSPDEFGRVGPDEFIPLAERTGLILPIGDWVLRSACKELRSWKEAGFRDLCIAVNVSSQQLQKEGLVESVESALRDYDIDPRRLELEITETALLSDEPIVRESLDCIRNAGVRIALDDFGTGYSSLSHLVSFPIDVIKIDRSFVERIGAGEQGNAIISAVIAMAHRLEIGVVAEGVETEEQEVFLRANACDFLQGYRYSAPIDAEGFGELLRKGGAD